ncbi:glycine cleavage system T protein [Gigaspora margarita]|uniref:Aminomethyltransferase n=1 Tax=Gigaspora margarita TaxID=4874 RepID=A0A8H4AN78_GIGMA|nr:glycine cleavage system T protein [Gigaspora margarita]
MRGLTFCGRVWPFRLSSGVSSSLKQTPLYNYHIEKGGKMVPFAGWSMPVYYANQGVLSEHIHTREYASLFDVSHMLQFKILGKDRIRFLESLVVADIEEMPFGSSVLSVFTNENGGIIDDTVICKHADHLYVVSNAACADKDLAHVRTKMGEFQNKGGWVDLKVIDDRALLALQGPLAAEILRKLCDKDLSDFMFMTARFLHVKTIESHVSRSGYTGEDGFEISIAATSAQRLAKLILGYPSVHFAGLGARDSLRLEAGLCLYGHDLDDSITPVEAGLSWTIGKRRRVEGGFLGANRILSQLKGGVARRRVGLMIEGAPARENAEIYNSDDELIGKVTSGGPSPTLNKNIAMGYVKSGFHKSGTLLKVKVRNKLQDAKIVKMPFVPSKYHK